MTRIVHLSDLHFGLVHPGLVEALVAEVNRLDPDAVAVSGDLTQRARAAQFAAARAFLDRLDAPVIAVPGNHDIPLDRPFARVLAPFAGYRRHISPLVAPRLAVAGAQIAGLNTATGWRWQAGRLSAARLGWTCAALQAGEGWRIVVAHHPFSHGPETHKTLMRNAEAGLARLAGCGAALVLSGHVHRWRIAPWYDPHGRVPLLQIQAGSALSGRRPGEANDFALLELAPGRLEVTRFEATPARDGFAPADRHGFDHADGAWRWPIETAQGGAERAVPQIRTTVSASR